MSLDIRGVYVPLAVIIYQEYVVTSFVRYPLRSQYSLGAYIAALQPHRDSSTRDGIINFSHSDLLAQIHGGSIPSAMSNI